MRFGDWSIEYYGAGPYIIQNGARRIAVDNMDDVFEHLFRSDVDVYELVKLLLADVLELRGRIVDLESKS